jgi:hypothetical protein
VYTVLGRGLRRSAIETRLGHVLSPFVGRSSEVQTLHELLAQVEHGQERGDNREPNGPGETVV